MAPALARTTAPPFEFLVRPVRVPADETWIAPAELGHAQAKTRLRDLVVPHLTHRDEADAHALVARLEPRLLYVPFWRVKLAIPAAHVPAAAARSIAVANIEFPMPAPSLGGRAGVLMISARSIVPYEPRLPTFLGGDGALEVHRADLLPATNDRALSLLFEGDRVDADVDRASGERIAASTLVDLLQHPGAPVRHLFNPRIESTLFVLHPLFHASFGADDEHFVLFSARDGSLVSAHFPRPPTISERVRRFFKP